jgi:hypothetical protein
MPNQDAPDEAKPAAKKPDYHYYLDIRNDGKGVGPHTPGRIKWWLEHRKISPDTLARRVDQDKWLKLSEIKRFTNFLAKITDSPPPRYEKEPWEDDPVTEKQLKKLGYFNLPFPQTNLTKGEAARSISFYVEVDPEREMQYQTLPSSEEKRTQLCELIKKLPREERTEYAVTASLTKGEVADAMYEIEGRLSQLEYEKTELEDKKDEEEHQLMLIEHHFNDEEIREDFGYRKLTQKHLKLLLEYLPTHDPGWFSKSRYETAGVVLKLFPELKKAEKTHASRGGKHVQSSQGCLLILVPLVAILLYALKETLVHIR